ncbi:MAG: DNA-3-methyladenine glycosylase [Cytophagales bacterium]|nr:DNA-3-methyladenine glycosylase [Cytophagales bacterium]
MNVRVQLNELHPGPGKLTKAMGIDRTFNGKDLITSEVCIEEGMKVNNEQIVTSTRIGIDYAGPDAKLPWRFYLRDNEWISKV